MTKLQNKKFSIFLHVLNIIDTCLHNFKFETLKMGIITIEEIARDAGKLVSRLFLRQVVLTLKYAVHFVLDIVLNIKQFK